MNDLEAYALGNERLSALLGGQRLALLDCLATHDGAKTSDLTVAGAVVLSSLAKARRETLLELLELDDAMLIKLLQRIEALEQEKRGGGQSWPKRSGLDEASPLVGAA